MPDTGRFFNIDPLTEKYTYNSPYAFQENKLGMGRELEGLELGPNLLNNRLDSFAGYIGIQFTKAVQQVKTAVVSTATKAQNIVKDNKKEILKVAKDIQDAGDKTVKVGLAAAAVGSLAEGIGAAPGLKLAEVGSYLQLGGKLLETGTQYIAGDYDNANTNAAVEVTGIIVDKTLDNVLTPSHPSSKQTIRDIYNTTKENFKNDATDDAKEEVKKELKTKDRNDNQ